MSGIGSYSTPASGDPPPMKPKKYHWYASRYMCAITLATLLVLSAHHWITLARRRWAGRRGRGLSSLPPSRWRAFQQSVQTKMFLGSFPKWLYGPDTIADGLCTLVYCGLLFFFSINKSRLVGGQGNLANQMGVMAFSQLPLIILLVSKNNPITLLTGITYQKLNFLHRAASRACLLCSWVHAIGWTPRVWQKGHFSHGYIISGIIALFGFTMLWTTSLQIIRRVAWEFFIVAHIVFTLLFLVGAIFHWKRLMYWVWPALALWILDRLIRYIRLYRANLNPDTSGSAVLRSKGDCTIELLEWNVLRLTVTSPNMHWSPGQHAFLSMPTITQSLHESHPFSFANVPDGTSNNAVFIIKVHGGATKLLRDSMSDVVETGIPVYIEGPYGAVHSLREWDSVLLVAGGTGITFCLSHLHDLVHPPHGSERPRRVRLVWHVRQRTDVLWVVPLLNDIASLASDRKTEVRLDIFVTRSQHGCTNGSAPRTLKNPREDTTLLAEHKSNGHHTSSVNSQPLSFLSRTLQSLIWWHEGRADLAAIMVQEQSPSYGPLNVVTCGPRSLLQASRSAVMSVQEGGRPIHYYEETLGA